MARSEIQKYKSPFAPLQYSSPLNYHHSPNVWKASYTIRTSIFVDIPYWSPYSTDMFISCVIHGPSQWFFHYDARDRNRMDSGVNDDTWWYRTPSISMTMLGVPRCCHGPLAQLLMQWWPNRGMRATSGTRMLSKWHTKSLYYINADSQEFTFSGNIFLHLCFLPYQTWLYDIVACSGRHTYVKKTVSIMNLVKSK